MAGNEYKDVLRIWEARAGDAFKDKILTKQFGGTTDTYEIGAKDANGDIFYMASNKTPEASFVDITVTAWNDNRILYGDGIQISSFVYNGSLGLGTSTPGLNVGTADGDFVGTSMHIKDAVNAANLILDGPSDATHANIILSSSDGAGDSKIMRVTGGGDRVVIQGLSDDRTILEDNLLGVFRDAIYSDLLKSVEGEHQSADGVLRCDGTTGEIYPATNSVSELTDHTSGSFRCDINATYFNNPLTDKDIYFEKIGNMVTISIFDTLTDVDGNGTQLQIAPAASDGTAWPAEVLPSSFTQYLPVTAYVSDTGSVIGNIAISPTDTDNWAVTVPIDGTAALSINGFTDGERKGLAKQSFSLLTV